MDYLFIFGFQLLGLIFSVGKRVIVLRNEHKDQKFGQIMSIFWSEDWNTIMWSSAVVSLQLLVHAAILTYNAQLKDYQYFYLIAFSVALILGYAGQEQIYKVLGTAKDKLNEKAENIIKNV